jgi:putative thioredoxin
MAASPHVRDITTAEFAEAVIQHSHTTPVLVDFWAAWCGPCRALGPVLERLATEYEGGFLLAKVDTDREQALAQQFQIRSIPTVMLFRDGQRVGGFPGALPEGQLRQFLTQHGVEPGAPQALALPDEPMARLEALRLAVAAHPGRASLQLELAVLLAAHGEADEAAHALAHLPGAVFGDPRAERARARVALRAVVAGRDEGDALRAGAERVLAGDAEAGVAQLLEALRASRGASEREILLAALGCVEDEALVRQARRQMASALF